MTKETQPEKNNPKIINNSEMLKKIKVINELPEKIPPEKVAAALGAKPVETTGSNNLHLPLIAATRIISEPNAVLEVKEIELTEEGKKALTSEATSLPGREQSKHNNQKELSYWGQVAQVWARFLDRFTNIK